MFKKNKPKITMTSEVLVILFNYADNVHINATKIDYVFYVVVVDIVNYNQVFALFISSY